MFCMNCGTKLAEDAAFCTNCGTAVAGSEKKEEKKEKVKVVDNTVVLNVKPTFKFWYMLIPYVVTLFLIAVPLLIGMYIAETDSTVFAGITVISSISFAILIAIILFFVNKQYKAYNYDFYKTKVIYKDSFINISEKEVKYKNIREVYLRRGLIQRAFNLGTIVLYTNAETGYANGIFVNNVENAEELYKNIKALINDED